MMRRCLEFVIFALYVHAAGIFCASSSASLTVDRMMHYMMLLEKDELVNKELFRLQSLIKSDEQESLQVINKAILVHRENFASTQDFMFSDVDWRLQNLEAKINEKAMLIAPLMQKYPAQ
jgi:hypothetical protein